MRQVGELIDKGVVWSSWSPFCSPVLLVLKKNSTYKMCVEYFALNKIPIKNKFLAPRIEDIFDHLQGFTSTYHSRIDLKIGYHQVAIIKLGLHMSENIHTTAFFTQFGLYEFVVMPFGLTNALASFNRLMENIFCMHIAYTRIVLT